MMNIAKANISKMCINILQSSVAVFLSLLILGCTPETPTVSPDHSTELFDYHQAAINAQEQDQ